MDNFVILRIDDVGRKNYSIILNTMLKELQKRNIPCVLGVIACELEDDNNYIVSLKTNYFKNLEFALHGYYHKKDEQGNPEFKLLLEKDAQKLIVLGKSIMKSKLEVTPTTFIPPWNSASEDTKKALIKEGFKVYSGDQNEFNKSDLLCLGYNSSTSTFGPHLLVDLEKIKKECEESLAERGYCVIMIHPQDYLIDDINDQHKPDIDFDKYPAFIKLLDYLESKNVNFTTFNQIYDKF
jgi:hypothetical protein